MSVRDKAAGGKRREMMAVWQYAAFLQDNNQSRQMEQGSVLVG